MSVIRDIGGRKYVPAWATEPGAVSWDGETWRPLVSCEHVQDNQGLCHLCGVTLCLETWRLYEGANAPAPSPILL